MFSFVDAINPGGRTCFPRRDNKSEAICAALFETEGHMHFSDTLACLFPSALRTAEHLVGDRGVLGFSTAPLLKLRQLEEYEADILPVDNAGRPIPEVLEEQLRADTALVCLDLVNEETGVITDVPTLARIVKKGSKALVYVDASRAVGKLDLTSVDPCVDILGLDAFAAGAAGACMWVREGIAFDDWYTLFVSFQDFSLKAVEECLGKAGQRVAQYRECKDILEGAAIEAGMSVNCVQTPRVCNITSLDTGVEAEALLRLLSFNGVRAYCKSAYIEPDDPEPSHVMLAIGREGEGLHTNISFSFDEHITAEDTRQTARTLVKCVQSLKELGIPSFAGHPS